MWCDQNNMCQLEDAPPTPPDAGNPPLPPPACYAIGDPVNVAGGASVELIEDIRIRGSREDFVFNRLYTSTDGHWDYDASLLGLRQYWNIPSTKVPSPFGSSPTDEYSIKWWHNFYSFLRTDFLRTEGYISVREPAGYLARFSSCGAGCFVASDGSKMESDILGLTDAGYVLQRPNGEMLFYEAPYTDTNQLVNRYFLSRIQDEAGVVKVGLTYAGSSPDGGSLDGGCAAGVPYIVSIETLDGVNLSVSYRSVSNVEGSTDCVVAAINLQGSADGGAGSTNLVTYTYASDGGTEYGGLIAAAAFSGRTETYGYLPTEFVRSASGFVANHTYAGSFKVVEAKGPNEDLVISAASNASCPGSSDCGGNTPLLHTVTDSSAGVGDGTTGSPGLSSAYLTLDEYPSALAPRSFQRTDGCSVTKSCSPGTIDEEWSNYAAGPTADIAYLKGTADKRTNWTAYVYAEHGAYPSIKPEMTSRMRGALDKNGTSALDTESYTYIYGAYARQLLNNTQKISVLGGTGSSMLVTNFYDSSTNRLKATIRSGYSSVFNGTVWATQARNIGTFYFTNHACLGDAADALGRVLEVHGPCLVNGTTSTDCDAGGNVPLTQYFYWPSSAGGYLKNRLKQVSQFTAYAGGSCSAAKALTTTVDAYDGFGNAIHSTDPNGVVTTYSYQETRLTSQSTGGQTTNYGYDGTNLTYIELPGGNYEVFCYRSGTSSGCSGGTLTNQLQWRAKSASSTGSTWSEKIVYSYWPDGTVNTETYETSTGEVRHVVKRAADAHRRPTWSQAGDATGSFASVRFFDRADNLAGVGFGYTAPPAFCGGPMSGSGAGLDSPLSTLCASLGYDRANRLIGLDEYPTSSGGATRTCMAYDAQGNVASVVSGCNATGNPGDCSSCTQPVATYQYDDFGNVVAATLPWTGTSSAGTTKYAYDASGHVVTKQTPSMASVNDYLQFAYDSVGRMLSLTHYYTLPSSGNEVLYAFGYDNSATLSGTCPQPTNTLGRMQFRTDSFGSTWYQYDVWGHTTGEVRLRTGSSTCSTSTPHLNPHTTYTYSSSGDLTSMVYPYGRTVTYTYGTGALLDRVSSISVTKWSGTTWSTQSNIISGAVWEPYGGLRGYQINHPTSGNASGVEYFLGDDSAATPSSGCPSSVPSTSSSDHTGRIRALWVSTGTFSAGSGNGATYKRTYSWQADQLHEEDTCLLGATTPRTVVYAYDQLLRVTTGSSSNFATSGGAFGSRSYTYDGRGNRTGESHEDCSYTDTYGSTSHPDQLTKQASSCSNAILKHSYSYDADGRVATKTWPVDSSGDAGTVIIFSSGDLGAASNGALDTVFKSVSVNGAVYNYYYDAFNRRRLKVYPAGPLDEAFHDRVNEMLVDQGNDSVTSPTWFPTDEYVWLGGRPVVLVRSKFNTSWTRQIDLSGDCTRNADAAPCGFYFPVTDTVGKPVLMLDASRNVTGAADYDIFGLPNRVSLNKETAHPYANNTNIILADFIQPLGGTANPSIQVRVRAVFDLIDTEGPSGNPADYLYLKDPDGGAALTAHLGGPHLGQLWTAWVIPSAGRVQVPFVSNATGNTYTGVVMAGYEYQRFQTGAQPFWTPLGLGGQYHDSETDLFQNWNRFYDASTGRYLESEPLLQKPGNEVDSAAATIFLPAYAYALDNPIGFEDSSGTQPAPVLPLPVPVLPPPVLVPPQSIPFSPAFNPWTIVPYILLWPSAIAPEPPVSPGGGPKNPNPAPSPSPSPSPGSPPTPSPTPSSGGAGVCCPPCPPPRPPDLHRVPPSKPHYPCPGDHSHTYVMNQNPTTCQCFERPGPVICH